MRSKESTVKACDFVPFAFGIGMVEVSLLWGFAGQVENLILRVSDIGPLLFGLHLCSRYRAESGDVCLFYPARQEYFPYFYEVESVPKYGILLSTMSQYSLVCVHLLDLMERAHALSQDYPCAVIQDGKVLIANRPSRRRGVKIGTSLESLRAYCPDAHIIEYDADSVRLWQQTALELISEFSSFVEYQPPNLLFLAIPSAVSLEQTAQMMAESLQRQPLQSAIGIAPGRLSVVIACRLSLGTGQVISILPPPLNESLAKLPLTLLPARFNKMVQRCHLMGWFRFADIAQITLQQAKSTLGPEAVELWALSQGHDQWKISPNYPPMKLEWKGTLPSELTSQSLRQLSKRLADKINRSLQKEAAEAAQLSLNLCWGAFNQSYEMLLKNPTRDPKALRNQLNHLWEQMLNALRALEIEPWEESYWSLHVSWKRSQAIKQLSLETEICDDYEKAALQAIERLNRRYGKVVTSLSDMTFDWEAKMRDFYRESNLTLYDF